MAYTVTHVIEHQLQHIIHLHSSSSHVMKVEYHLPQLWAILHVLSCLQQELHNTVCMLDDCTYFLIQWDIESEVGYAHVIAVALACVSGLLGLSKLSHHSMEERREGNNNLVKLM